MNELSHVDESGDVRMVDVGGKPLSRRRAVARAERVVAVGLELFRHPGRRSEHIKAMKCSRVNVQFGGHAGLYKTLGVIDILVDEQIKCAD